MSVLHYSLYWCWALENWGVSVKYTLDEPYDIHLAKDKDIEELKQQHFKMFQVNKLSFKVNSQLIR